MNCYALPAVEVGTAVETIGAEAFRATSALASTLEFPALTSLGGSAFRNSAVPGLVIGDLLEEIGSYAFYYATGLVSMTIGSGLKTIGMHAFSGASELVTLSMGTAVETIGTNAFHSCNKLSSTVSIPNVIDINA